VSNTRRPRNPQLGKDSAARAIPLIVAAIVLVCIGAVVAIAVLLKGGGSDNSTAPSTTQTSAAASNLNCTPAPAAPGQGPQFKQPPNESLAGDATWTATLETNCGDIVLELDGKSAPQTVSSFVFLAQKGYFDDSPCHRLTTQGLYVLQCGDPTGSGGGGPGYGFGIENAPKSGDYPRGTVAMARTSDPNSNGSQFFLVYKDTQLPTTGGGYSIFGKVTQGLDLLDELAKAGVQDGSGDGTPAQPISILSVTVRKA
jgi:peptidyl-prolyl cis-trans isomerase B (cyclophilin B)